MKLRRLLLAGAFFLSGTAVGRLTDNVAWILDADLQSIYMAAEASCAAGLLPQRDPAGDFSTAVLLRCEDGSFLYSGFPKGWAPEEEGFEVD